MSRRMRSRFVRWVARTCGVPIDIRYSFFASGKK